MLPSEASHFAAVRSCVPPWLRTVKSLSRTKLGNVLASLVRSSSTHPAISGDPSICIGPRRGARPARPGPPQLQGTKVYRAPQCVERRCISHTPTPVRVGRELRAQNCNSSKSRDFLPRFATSRTRRRRRRRRRPIGPAPEPQPFLPHDASPMRFRP